MTRTILVTGVTGTVGQHVPGALDDRECTVRAGVRDPEAGSMEISGTTDIVEFDFDKPDTWGGALADVDGLFLVRPPTVDATTIGEFAEAAARAGVGQIAYLSTLGAEKNVLIPHHRIEKRITSSGTGYTLLRASFFMQNLLDVHRTDIVENDEIFVPAGDGKTSFVDARDIGEVAATVLTEAGHQNRAYDITGPEALDYGEVASIFEDVLDRAITYPKPSLFQFGWRMAQRGNSLGFIALMCAIYTTARLGLAARVTTDAKRILDRDPRRMRAFVEDYKEDFRNDPDLA